MPLVYILEGDPIPLARARVARRTNRVFDSQKAIKLAAQITLQNQHGENELYKGPLKIDAYFYFPIPKSHRKTKPLDYKTSKPDADNLVKLVLDVCNQILFHDDSQIVEMICHKMYDTLPRTEFTITELGKHGKEKESARQKNT